MPRTPRALLFIALALFLPGAALPPMRAAEPPPVFAIQPPATGCESCHAGIEPMHASPLVRLSCTDCHGGDASAGVGLEIPPGAGPASLGAPRDPAFVRAMLAAHVAPRNREVFGSSANPVRSYTALNDESPEFIRFFNPGDLRVAALTCGTAGCHAEIVTRVGGSMMTHGAMLWGAALYNNGTFPWKDARFGESYAPDGRPQRLEADPPPGAGDTLARGWLASLDPLPRYEQGEPGNILRIFERGGKKPFETGTPERDEEPGRPARRLSARGLGTATRTDPVLIGLQKTRLLDPTLNFLGTNDHPGDYRSSGCTGCHVIYANDADPVRSGSWARYGNRGLAAGGDRAIPAGEPGHPVRHQFTRSIPTSQCVVCHMHPGTNVVNTYTGTIWWDNETEGVWMYPRDEARPTLDRQVEALQESPEGASVRGLWNDRGFLERIEELNARLRRTQLAGFAGHGFVFRKVYKQDRKGRLLDADGAVVPDDDPAKFQRAVHLQDIHLEKGMQCVDCHFEQDSHGTGRLEGEVRAAIEIDCVDCHGTIDSRATLVPSAAASGGETARSLETGLTPFGRRRFAWRGGKLFQRSMMEPGIEWEVVQVRDTIDPASDRYSEASRLAKTIRRDGATWGDVSGSLAHANENMTCFACHTSWATSCFGCHLPMKADMKTPQLHNEGDRTRNFTSYNFQTLRDDVFMLGRDGTVTGRRIAPVRSACAVLVSSQNVNREWIYTQQQTISAEGFSGTAFSPFVPHTVRSRETKTCTDCHLSAGGENNAWIASTLGQGTGFVNFIGRYAWVGEGGPQGKEGGFEAVVVTERDEPQAVIGSRLHELAWPDRYREHIARGGRLEEAEHHGGQPVRSLQLRGEYLYAAAGSDGLVVYDVANVDNKGFSERTVTAPVSPLGQRLYVRTRDAAAVASPSTMALDPLRSRLPENQEGPIAAVYGYLYIADMQEGLVVVGAATLLDGDPTNNFLERAATFNPEGALAGARAITIAGEVAWIGADAGLAAVSLADPAAPKLLAMLGPPAIRDPRAIAVQFRYAFVLDEDGLKVVDVTQPAAPRLAASLALPGASDVYLARDRAYIAAGPAGLAIVDIERPEAPALLSTFDAGGAMNDARAVRLGMTNASLFAYVADGVNGLRVLQLASPEDTPGIFGFSPQVTPRLIATYPTHSPAIALSRGLDRDRAVDESGNQLSVFGRRGSGPLDAAEMRRMYLREGVPWTVSNSPPGAPREFVASPRAEPAPSAPYGTPWAQVVRRDETIEPAPGPEAPRPEGPPRRDAGSRSYWTPVRRPRGDPGGTDASGPPRAPGGENRR